jgi:hypothetical protein
LPAQLGLLLKSSSSFSEDSTKCSENLLDVVEKGESMEYHTPTVELMGPASELIQAYVGPLTDGGGYTFSQGNICSPLEEE